MTKPWAYVVAPAAGASVPTASPLAAPTPAEPAPAAAAARADAPAAAPSPVPTAAPGVARRRQVRARSGPERLHVDKVPGQAASRPPRVHPVRALVGASLAVAGVALGIGGLLLVVDQPGSTTQPAALGAASPSAAAPSAQVPAAQVPAAQVHGPAAPSEQAVADDAPDAEPTGAPAATPTEPAAAKTPAETTEEPAATTEEPGATTGSAVPRTPAAAQPAAPALTVLNNSRLTGLAAAAAARFADDGWPIAIVGNYNGRLRNSTVYYLPGQRAAALRLARQYGVPRVLPRPERLPGRGLTVVLTRLTA